MTSLLQRRLAVLFGLSFWMYAVLFLGVFLAYQNMPQYEPANVATQHAIAIAMFAVVLVGWFLTRGDRQLSDGSLAVIEWAFVIVTGPHFGLQTYLNAERITPPLLLLVYAIVATLARAIIVPSTWRRTAMLGGVAMLGWGVPAAIAVLSGMQRAPEFPPSMLVPFIVLLCAGVTALAAGASHITFELQRKLDETARAGAYRLGAKLGEGAGGDVYEARHAAHRRPLAVKVLDGVSPEDTRRLAEVLDRTSRLVHPGIARMYDYGSSSAGSFYYAMERIDGVDLEALVREFGPQPVVRVLPMLRHMCEALHGAHGEGVVHRDVKPANAILTRWPGMRESVVLVDFGIVPPLNPDSQLTSPDIVEGTPGYMAPEAVTDPDVVGPQADVYSLGAVAYFLLTGQTVFDGETVAEMCAQHIHNEPRPPSVRGSDIPPEVDELVLACLAKKPEERPTLGEELCAQLRSLDSGAWTTGDEDQWWRDYQSTRDVDPSASASIALSPVGRDG